MNTFCVVGFNKAIEPEIPSAMLSRIKKKRDVRFRSYVLIMILLLQLNQEISFRHFNRNPKKAGQESCEDKLDLTAV